MDRLSDGSEAISSTPARATSPTSEPAEADSERWLVCDEGRGRIRSAVPRTDLLMTAFMNVC